MQVVGWLPISAQRLCAESVCCNGRGGDCAAGMEEQGAATDPGRGSSPLHVTTVRIGCCEHPSTVTRRFARSCQDGWLATTLQLSSVADAARASAPVGRLVMRSSSRPQDQTCRNLCRERYASTWTSETFSARGMSATDKPALGRHPTADAGGLAPPGRQKGRCANAIDSHSEQSTGMFCAPDLTTQWRSAENSSHRVACRARRPFPASASSDQTRSASHCTKPLKQMKNQYRRKVRATRTHCKITA